MRIIHWIALIIVIIGALNSGIFGFFNINVISGVFAGPWSIDRIIYAIIGIAGLWSFVFFKFLAEYYPKNDKPNS